jgi:hypothetical protein
MPTAIDISSVAGLIAVGIFTAQILLGLLQNRPVDFIDAEKAYVEGCALLVAAATAWRFARRRQLRRSPLSGRGSPFKRGIQRSEDNNQES